MWEWRGAKSGAGRVVASREGLEWGEKTRGGLSVLCILIQQGAICQQESVVGEV